MQTKYTPSQMIAFLASQFVNGDAPPAIDGEGNPVYELTTNEKVGKGCFAYTVAKAHPKLIEALRKTGTHANANIGGLVANGVAIMDVLDAPARWDDDKAENFMQALQNVHDDAARTWFKMERLIEGGTDDTQGARPALLMYFRQNT